MIKKEGRLVSENQVDQVNLETLEVRESELASSQSESVLESLDYEDDEESEEDFKCRYL
jgi:hypothetical protein